MAYASTIATPDLGQLGAVSSEVAAGLAARGTHEGYIATAVSTMATQAAADVNAVGALIPSSRTVTIAFGDFAALGAGVKTKDYSVGAALPTGAILMATPRLSSSTGFDDATHGTFAVTVGTSTGGNQLGTSTSVATGAGGFPKLMTGGSAAYVTADVSGVQASARITSSVDLNTATIGSVVVTLYYFVPA